MTEDERLSSFLDGELTASGRAALVGDGQAQTRLTRLRATDDLVRAAYAGPMHEPVPDRLMAAFDKGIFAHGEPAGIDETVPTASNDNDRRRWLTGGAMAASLALGLLLGPMVMRGSGSDGVTSVAFNGALDTTPSLQTASISSGERLTPQLSFAKTGGGYCRQFELVEADKASTGVACADNGKWAIKALLPSRTKTSATYGYGVAEGPEDTGLAAVIDTLRKGDPLDKAAEQGAIVKHWR